MDDTITSVAHSAKQAEAMKLGMDLWFPLIIAFFLGSFTSAFWGLRQGAKVHWYEVTSTVMCAGMISVLFWSLMFGYNLPIGLHIAVSIACGFTGDSLVRITVNIFVTIVKKIINPDFFK